MLRHKRTRSGLQPLCLLTQLLALLLLSSSALAARVDRVLFLGITRNGKRVPELDQAVRQRIEALAVQPTTLEGRQETVCEEGSAVKALAQRRTEPLVLAGQHRTSAHGCLVLLWLHSKATQQLSTRALSCSRSWTDTELATNVAELAGALLEQARQGALLRELPPSWWCRITSCRNRRRPISQRPIACCR